MPALESAATATSPLELTRLWQDLHESRLLALHAAMYTWPAARLAPGWVLDVGCEYGFGSLLIQTANPRLRVAGLDRDLPALRVSRDLVPDQIWPRLHADGARIPVSSASMSGVYCIHLLHSLQDPDEAVLEMWRVLRPGGLLIAALPREAVGEPGAEGERWMARLTVRMRMRFADVAWPTEIFGHLPSHPPQRFAMNDAASPWMAVCRKA